MSNSESLATYGKAAAADAYLSDQYSFGNTARPWLKPDAATGVDKSVHLSVDVPGLVPVRMPGSDYVTIVPALSAVTPLKSSLQENQTSEDLSSVPSRSVWIISNSTFDQSEGDFSFGGLVCEPGLLNASRVLRASGLQAKSAEMRDRVSTATDHLIEEFGSVVPLAKEIFHLLGERRGGLLMKEYESLLEMLDVNEIRPKRRSLVWLALYLSKWPNLRVPIVRTLPDGFISAYWVKPRAGDKLRIDFTQENIAHASYIDGKAVRSGAVKDAAFISIRDTVSTVIEMLSVEKFRWLETTEPNG